MKRLPWLFLLAACGLNLSAQVTLPVLPDSLFSTYFHQRWTLFERLPVGIQETIFVGNSLTDGGEWEPLFRRRDVLNQGISGDVSAGVLKRLPGIARRKPDRVFLMIGVNDLARGISPDSIAANIFLAARHLRRHSPATRLLVQSVLPVSDRFGRFGQHVRRGPEVEQLNRQLRDAAATYEYTFIDLHGAFADSSGRLDARYTNDGLHLTGAGYLHWQHLIFPHVTGLEKKPALIPEPRQLNWREGYFLLSDGATIVVPDSLFRREANYLRDMITSLGWSCEVSDKEHRAGSVIVLENGRVESASRPEEAYELEVGANRIRLRAETAAGMFYAVQTLRQLMRNGFSVDACRITDWPAFSWRGFMVDVGRNYQSPRLLREQIDRMAAYKLNVFHFHATEDIAWRLEIRKYPQLTRPEHMLRDKGLYYSQEEIRELAAYCRERHILFLPEIDMPGHSAAFRRATGVDMQSDSGMYYVREILKEWCETFDFPYLHLGADEVKITREDFLPAMTDLLHGYGRQVIGWEPGGNFHPSTIRQLWMDDLARISRDTQIRYIDSRHLYLNHMDPLEAVVTIFNRRMASQPAETRQAMGATLCVWHDRAVAGEEDVLRMNPVYPGMLAFAERIWRGGGQPGWIANISDGDVPGFLAFEQRLLEHRQLHFQQTWFPYAAQGDLIWTLVGPFDNQGDLSRPFWPEQDSIRLLHSAGHPQVRGGTQVLRHWWAPLIKGAVPDPRENSTWYAHTRIWSPVDTVRKAWTGFYNLSRSPATNSPPAGAWDERQSAVWVNGTPLPPPAWKRAGQKGHPEIPLYDEGYEYRPPARVALRRGWNDVLIKAPVGSFKGPDWHNPVKWMFTFLVLE